MAVAGTVPSNSINWAAVEAIGVVLAFGAAFWQLRRERVARLKQEANDRIAAQEIATREERAQADLLSAWIAWQDDESPNLTNWIAVQNSSNEPIYELILSVVAFQGAGDTGEDGPPFLHPAHCAFLSVAPPGLCYVTMGGGYSGMGFHPSIEVAFTDRSGKHWKRTGRGRIVQLDVPAPDYYDVPLPLPWALPMRAIDPDHYWDDRVAHHPELSATSRADPGDPTQPLERHNTDRAAEPRVIGPESD